MNTDFLNKTVVGVDFLNALKKDDYQPSIDKFLDYRSSLMKYKHVKQQPIKNEIKAVDEIITYLQKDGRQ